MVLGVSFAFAGCDKYTNTTYAMTSFGLYKVNGSEYNIKEYKDFLGISFADVQRIKLEYDIEIEDINSLKNFVSHYLGCTLNFGGENKVTLTQNKCLNYTIASYESTTWTGKYSIDSETGLSVLFPNYKLNNKGERVKTQDGSHLLENTAYVSGFAFGGTLIVGTPDDKTITLTMLRGATDQSDRAVLTFTKQK